MASSFPSLSPSSLSFIDGGISGGAVVDDLQAVSGPPSIAVVSEHLYYMYRRLNKAEQATFREIYKALFGYLSPLAVVLQDYGSLAHNHLLPSLAWRHRLTMTDLTTLSKLWLLTGAGKEHIKSKSAYWSTGQYKSLHKFEARGILARTHYNPAQPYLRRSPKACYYSITPKGAMFYRRIVINYRRMILDYYMKLQHIAQKKGKGR